MRPLRRIRRVFALPVNVDVGKEIAFHIDMRVRELEGAGWESSEARLEARRLFGDLNSVSARCRAITRQHRRARRRADMFDALCQDLKYGTRTLWKNPGFTLVALLTLALGVGATSAIFSVVDGVLLSPLEYPEPRRLVTLLEESARGNTMRVPEANFVDWRDHGRGFEGMAMYSGYGMTTVLGGAMPVRASAAPVSADFFSVLGVEPLVGRTFLDEESRFGGDPAVVAGYGFWRRHLEGSRNLDGRTLRFDGRIYRVVGVMPPGFDFPEGAELWYPTELSGANTSRTAHNWNVIARLAPQASLDGVRADMSSLAARIKKEYGDDVDAVGVRVTELRDELVGGVRRPLVLLLAASALVLLVAATNLASTLLARAVARQREIAVRTAIGAGRMRVVRQLLTETVLLTTLGGLAGLGLATLLVRALKKLGPTSLPRLDEVAVDSTVLLFTLGVSIVTGLVFGLVPALQASRTDLRGVMSDGAVQGGVRSRVWNLLVGTEVALAAVLLMGSAWLIRSFWELVSVEPGFSTEEVVTFDVTVPGIQVPDEFEFEPYRREERKMAAFYRDLLPAVASVPGVRHAGLVNNLPLGSFDPNGAFVREGQPEEEYSSASYRVVGGDYFAAMGMPLVRGRLFDSRESGGPHTALVNEDFARRYFKDEDPVGQRIRSFGMDLWWDDWMTIVGIVGDVRHRGLDQAVSPEIYVSVEQRAYRAGWATMVVKADGSVESIAAALRARVRELYPEMPFDFATLETILVRSVERERFTMLLLAGFAALALMLAAIGIYGVVSYAVAQRTREMGIRIALGAGPGSLLRLMMRDSMAVVATGVTAGWAGAFALSRTLESQLFATSATDASTYVAVALVLALAALGASYLPARRSTGIDPILAIRDE